MDIFTVYADLGAHAMKGYTKYMIISVIAANGRSGSIFCEAALNAGHEIRAGVFHSNTLTPHERLIVVQCNAQNIDEVTELLTGSDAVVSFIGHVRGSQANVQTQAMKNILKAMQQTGVQRLVSLTGTGVRQPGDKISIIDHILNLTIGVIDPARIKDGKDHVVLLQNSSVQWTVLRVLKLSGGEPKTFRLLAHGPAKLLTSRQEVALAALEVLENYSYVQQLPVIANAR
jgi:hypothetical protein